MRVEFNYKLSACDFDGMYFLLFSLCFVIGDKQIIFC